MLALLELRSLTLVHPVGEDVGEVVAEAEGEDAVEAAEEVEEVVIITIHIP
jgi:hypothetical protein